MNNYNIMMIAECYPNQNASYTKCNFIQDQVNLLNSSFQRINVVSPLIKSFNIIRKERMCKDYQYQNIHIYYPKSFYIPKSYQKNRLMKIDYRSHSIKNILKNKKIKFDLIHAHNGIMGNVAIPIVNKYKVPFITSFYGHGAYIYIYDKKYYKELFGSVDLITSLSHHMTNRLIELGCSKKKIVQHNLGVDITHFKPGRAPEKKKVGKKIVFCLVARFAEIKGIFDSIEAFHIISKMYTNVEFELVGDGPLYNKIVRFIEKFDLKKKIRIINNLKSNNPRGIVLERIQKCDIFLLPSKRSILGDSEGTPVVLMEASACMKPCITTFHSGNPDVVLNGKTGIVVNPGEIQQIVNAMKLLIENEELREKFGREARNHITINYNSKIQNERLIDIYNQIIADTF